MHHEVEQRYACKLHHFASERRPERPHVMQQSNDYNRLSEYGRRKYNNRECGNLR
jgi:hypothetical protein